MGPWLSHNHVRTSCSLAAANRKWSYAKDDFGLPPDVASWTDEDHECFLAALVDMQREERKRAGLLGRWPIWELRHWAILHPESTTMLGCVGIFMAGVALGLLWPVVTPWVVLAAKTARQAWEFLAAIVAALQAVHV